MLTKIYWWIVYSITDRITGLDHNGIKGLVNVIRWFKIESMVIYGVNTVVYTALTVMTLYIVYLVWVAYNQFKNRYYRRLEL